MEKALRQSGRYNNLIRRSTLLLPEYTAETLNSIISEILTPTRKNSAGSTRRSGPKMSAGSRILKGTMGAFQIVDGVLQAGVGNQMNGPFAMSLNLLARVLPPKLKTLAAAPTKPGDFLTAMGISNVAQGIGEIKNAFKGKNEEAPNHFKNYFESRYGNTFEKALGLGKGSGKDMAGLMYTVADAGSSIAIDAALSVLTDGAGSPKLLADLRRLKSVPRFMKYMGRLREIRALKKPVDILEHLGEIIKDLRKEKGFEKLVESLEKLYKNVDDVVKGATRSYKRKGKTITAAKKITEGWFYQGHHVIMDSFKTKIVRLLAKGGKILSPSETKGIKRMVDSTLLPLPTLLEKVLGGGGRKAIHYGSHPAEYVSKVWKMVKDTVAKHPDKPLEALMRLPKTGIYKRLRRGLETGRNVVSDFDKYVKDYRVLKFGFNSIGELAASIGKNAAKTIGLDVRAFSTVFRSLTGQRNKQKEGQQVVTPPGNRRLLNGFVNPARAERIISSIPGLSTAIPRITGYLNSIFPARQEDRKPVGKPKAGKKTGYNGFPANPAEDPTMYKEFDIDKIANALAIRLKQHSINMGVA